MTYIPNTDNDRELMLKKIGVSSIEELFTDIPKENRFPSLNIPDALSELETVETIKALARENSCYPSFLGGGVYNHFVPTVVDYLASRGEFVTPYTPYQAEASQGTLRAHFEFQSMITALTGMDYAVLSHYDGATAFSESVMMAINFSRGKKTSVKALGSINPDYIKVARTYLQYQNKANIDVYDGDMMDIDFSSVAAVTVQTPDFLGNILNPAKLREIADIAHDNGAKLIVITDPIFLGMFSPPKEADMVVMEGQPLGNYLSFGGPYLGVLTMKKEMVRVSTGRIVGETVDCEGKKGYTLTLSAREQHIKREKAASNICSNEAHCALRAAIYMAALGKNGMKRVAELSYHKSHYLARLISGIDGFEVVNHSPFFKEFTVKCPLKTSVINEILYEKYSLIGGIPFEQNKMIIAVTEVLSKDALDKFAAALTEIGRGK